MPIVWNMNNNCKEYEYDNSHPTTNTRTRSTHSHLITLLGYFDPNEMCELTTTLLILCVRVCNTNL